MANTVRSRHCVAIGWILVAVLLPRAAIATEEPGREVARINHEVARLIAAGRPDEAMVLAEQAVQLGESAIEETDPVFVESLRHLAKIEGRAGHEARARSLFERALEIQERALDPDRLELAETLEAMGHYFRSIRSFDDAVPLYQRVLALREESLGPEALGLVEPLRDLAGLQQQREQYSQARSLLERLTAIQEKSLGADHPALVDSLNFLSAVYRAEGNTARADASLNRALTIRRNSARELPFAKPGLGAIGINVVVDPSGAQGTAGKRRMHAGTIYFVRMDEGSEAYDTASGVWPGYSWREQGLLARRTTDILESTYSERGDVYLLNAPPGRYVAVGAVVVNVGPGQTQAYHAYFSTELVSRTEVSVAPGQFAYMGEVLATAQGTPDPTQQLFSNVIPRPDGLSVDVAGLGAVHYKKNPQWAKLDQVERGGKSAAGFWNRARRILKHETTWLQLVPDRESVGDPVPAGEMKLMQLGQSALDEVYGGSYREAVADLEQALGICESLPAAESTCLAPAIVTLADVLTSKNERPRAAPLYERALEVRERTLGTGHPAVACTLDGLARLSYLDGDHDKARGFEQRALEILEEALGPEHPAIADSLEFLARLHDTNGEDDQAVAVMEQALRVREDALGWSHLTLVPLLDFLAEHALAGSDHDRATELVERALGIQSRVFGGHSGGVGDSLYLLGRVQHGSGKHALAVESFERAVSIQTDAYGAGDRRTTDSMLALASVHETLGDSAQAKRIRTQANAQIQNATLDDLESMGEAFLEYTTHNGGYPSTTDIEELKQLLHPTYTRRMPLEDGWGNRYVVESGAEGYSLRSLGSDGRSESSIGGQTSSFTADIVFTDGGFAQWPVGPQK